jgi:hypothetical protein
MATRKFRKVNRKINRRNRSRKTKYVKLVKRLKKCKKNNKTLVKKMNRRRKTKTHKGRKMRGGYGKVASPFVGSPWSATPAPAPGNYYGLSPDGIGVGGPRPFFANKAWQPQRSWVQGGGSGNTRLTPQPLVDVYRAAVGGFRNGIDDLAGRPRQPSSRASVQSELKPTGGAWVSE